MHARRAHGAVRAFIVALLLLPLAPAAAASSCASAGPARWCDDDGDGAADRVHVWHLVAAEGLLAAAAVDAWRDDAWLDAGAGAGGSVLGAAHAGVEAWSSEWTTSPAARTVSASAHAGAPGVHASVEAWSRCFSDAWPSVCDGFAYHSLAWAAWLHGHGGTAGVVDAYRGARWQDAMAVTGVRAGDEDTVLGAYAACRIDTPCTQAVLVLALWHADGTAWLVAWSDGAWTCVVSRRNGEEIADACQTLEGARAYASFQNL